MQTRLLAGDRSSRGPTPPECDSQILGQHCLPTGLPALTATPSHPSWVLLAGLCPLSQWLSSSKQHPETAIGSMAGAPRGHIPCTGGLSPPPLTAQAEHLVVSAFKMRKWALRSGAWAVVVLRLLSLSFPFYDTAWNCVSPSEGP